MAATVGAVAAGDSAVAVPPLPATFTEYVLEETGLDVSWLPIRYAPTGTAVRAWLEEPLRTRAVGPLYDPARDAEHYVTTPTVASAVDAFLHVRTSTATTPV